ncbi:MAG: hypothetical protein ACYC5N_06335, partial [Endomicrobiales bacterium]
PLYLFPLIVVNVNGNVAGLFGPRPRKIFASWLVGAPFSFDTFLLERAKEKYGGSGGTAPRCCRCRRANQNKKYPGARFLKTT